MEKRRFCQGRPDVGERNEQKTVMQQFNMQQSVGRATARPLPFILLPSSFIPHFFSSPLSILKGRPGLHSQI